MPTWYMHWRNTIKILHALAALPVFGYSYHRRKGFPWRILLSGGGTILVAYLVQYFLYTPGIIAKAILSQGLVSFIDYILVMLVYRFCLEESFWTCLFVTTAAMTAQGLGGCVKTIVRLIPAMNALALDDLGILLVDALCFGTVYALLFFIFRPFTRDREEIVGTKRKAIFSTVVLLFYLATTWLTRDYSDGQNNIQVLVSNVSIITTQALIYTVQFGLMERDRMSRNIELMRELIHEQHTQYENSRESVQLINEKYHDLKNLISSFQGVVPEEELKRLKAMVARYDVHVHTGSQVLDVVLTEKMDLCLQRGITMTCHFGQTDFSFMEELDLYTLFNNALTNAINAVLALPESQSRFIVLTALQDHNILTIHVENPCREDITFVDGLPQTTGDTQWHGFGMKSMARTAEKYGGALSVSEEGGRFQLDILLLNLTEEVSQQREETG